MVDGNGTMTFVGNATMVLRLGAFTVLTDPNFIRAGERAYLGKGLWSRRLKDPAMQPGDLPALDAIVLSHLHGDHWDRVAYKELGRTQPVITTPAAARRLSRSGFATHGLETWQRHTLERDGETLTVEALPGTHARGSLRALLPPVMGSLLEHRDANGLRLRMLISGDTLTGDHVDAVRERHPELDVAVVHLGGTRVLFHTVTMDGAQGADYLGRLRPPRTIPVHVDDYRVQKSPLADFLRAAEEAGLAAGIRPVGRGETVPLPPP